MHTFQLILNDPSLHWKPVKIMRNTKFLLLLMRFQIAEVNHSDVWPQAVVGKPVKERASENVQKTVSSFQVFGLL